MSSPRISVVIAATEGPSAARATLAAFGVVDPRVVEILVVHPAAPNWPSAPGWVASATGAGVPHLRRLGLDQARGRVVVFTEDSCRPEPGWADAWISAFADPVVVAATGPVQFDPEAPPRDRAVALCEYAPFRADPTRTDEPPARLAGNNFAVRRDVACAVVEGGDGGVHECQVRPAVQGLGRTVLVRTAVVRHVRRYPLLVAFGDRFRFGREFGALRGADLPLMGRVLGWGVGPLVFAVQVGRLACWIVPQRGGELRADLRAVPRAVALLLAWSLGEWVGWAGVSLEWLRLACGRRRGTGGRSVAPAPGPTGG